MKLIVHELGADGLIQVMRPSLDTNVEAIRPHIYRHNSPTGSLKIQLIDADDNVVAESESIDITDIGTLAFFHGYVRFFINAMLAKNEDYSIKLTGIDGYVFNESAYIGWVNGYDLAKYNAVTPTNDSLKSALDLEIWQRINR